MRFGVRPERHFYIFHIEQHRPVDADGGVVSSTSDASHARFSRGASISWPKCCCCTPVIVAYCVPHSSTLLC
jgi:hypothetical protein